MHRMATCILKSMYVRVTATLRPQEMMRRAHGQHCQPNASRWSEFASAKPFQLGVPCMPLEVLEVACLTSMNLSMAFLYLAGHI